MTNDNQDLFHKPLVVAYFNVDFKLNAKGKYVLTLRFTSM